MKKDDEKTLDDVFSKIKSRRKTTRKKKLYATSKLNKYRAQIERARAAGLTLKEVQFFLRKEKRMLVSISAIARFLKKHNV